jgi:phosphoribosylformimino-5-aminoimidazole carboxamide ribotide isomerase
MIIFPAIDIIDAKCVRLSQGDYDAKTIYNDNPLEVAKSFEAAGLSHLHLVDLDGAKAGKVINWDTIQNICTHTGLTVDFGGGIKTEKEVEKLLHLGVRQINLGSIAVKEPEQVKRWLKKYGSEKIILSADVKGKEIAIHGWQEGAGIQIEQLIQDFLPSGLQFVTCTDISTDGMLKGPNLALYQDLKNNFPQLNIIASGGVSSKEDLAELKKLGLHGAIVGKAIYENKIQLADLNNI